ncbi:hypothetical protein BDP55DRAFT_647519 [Colletotrichum godetiae]|uniref:MADS-box domain-containing protein n=1 Tax=Colletotrichum godetiae TaxID=1209918 RepID=A0AAJ0AXY0_9PEZI|nr:uncharacterized protein BDP55DRAFT_647519 [Colletotrichum godetiae]KAK1691607.1 hypothetical protein BDP55DRAFT_647519 [Colletotrichum godetiae]
MPRLKSNKDPRKGLENRRNGIFKKSNTFYRIYGAQIAVIVHYQGQVEAYESHPGFLRSQTNTSVAADCIKGPDDFDLVRDRTVTEVPTSQAYAPVALMKPSIDEDYSDIFTPPLVSSSSSNITTESSFEPRQNDEAESELFIDMLPHTPPMALPSDSIIDEDAPTPQKLMEASGIILPSMLLQSSLPTASAGEACSASAEELPLHHPRPISIRRKQALLSLAGKFFE